MASTGEEVEYESDPEEAKRSLTMRRREASDDEGEEEGGNKRVDRRSGIRSDDSDGQGGIAEDDYDEGEYNEDGDEDEERYDEDEEGNGVEEEVYEGKDGEGNRHEAEESVVSLREADSNLRSNLVESVEDHPGNGEDEEETKENEPFAVPMAGAFYMHDDRFRDNTGGLHRWIRGGRRLWESKDDRKWGHDKFEEINLQGRQYKEGRSASRGSSRGRGRGKGRGRAVTQACTSRNRKVYKDINNQTQAHRTVSGRGSHKYEPARKNDGQTTQTQKQSGRPLEKTPHASSSRTSMSTSNAESESGPAMIQVVTSSLNYASPPFYPSAASNKDVSLAQKRDVQTGTMSRNSRTKGVMNDCFSVPQANGLLQGKTVVQSVRMDKVHIEKSAESAGKALNNLQLLPGSSGAPHPRVAGRGVPVTGQMSYQPVSHQTQVNRLSPAQIHAVQLSSVPGRAITQRMGQHSGRQGSSPPKASLAENSFESGAGDIGSESSKSKMDIVGKGRASTQGSGSDSFLYGGEQVMGVAGNMGVNHEDQNFPGTPAFLPFMQFGCQHPRGVGVPAVGMAFPGYVAHRQLGLGNSEMTWLPVLAGAAGAMGATYCSPYLAVDDTYTRQSGQTSSMDVSSKENSTGKSNNELKSSQGPEIASDEYGQRQNKPRRYSEMNFGQ